MKQITFKMLPLVAGLLAAAAPITVEAQQVPGPHPAYIHALSDLRAARHYLHDGWAWGPVQHDDDAAVQEIVAAIEEIKKASINDGKGLDDPFPMDTKLSPQDRFHKANELLAAARRDIDKPEDVPQSRALRDQALKHIDRAHDIVDNAWRTSHWQ